MPLEKRVRAKIAGINPYKPGKPIGEVERELGLTDVIKMASNENPLGPSAMAAEAIRRAAGDVNFYPENSGFYLVRALSEKLGFPAESIVLGRGCSEVIELAVRTFVEPGDEVIAAHPSFLVYGLATQIAGGEFVRVPLTSDQRHDVDALAAAVTKRTKILFVCNPNNPTGTAIGQSEVDRLMSAVPDDVVVFFDEAYYEYVTRPDFPRTLPLVAAGRNVIVGRTFSKIYGLAGLRVGFGVTTPEIADYMNRARPPFNTSSVAQAGALAALSDTEHAERSARLSREGKEYLYARFEQLGVKYVPTEANFIVFDSGADGSSVVRELMQRGVIVRQMTSFGMEPPYVRVTIGTPEQNERFADALGEVLRAL